MEEIKDCSKCNSKCKKESPCGFFTDKKRSISEIAEEILHRRWRLVQDDEREAEEDERRHQEDMEAMWRDQQHGADEARIDEHNLPDHNDEVGIPHSMHINTNINISMRGNEVGNTREE